MCDVLACPRDGAVNACLAGVFAVAVAAASASASPFIRALTRSVGPFAVLALFFILGLGGGLLQFFQLANQLVHAFFVHFRCTGRGAVSITVLSWVDTVAHVVHYHLELVVYGVPCPSGVLEGVGVDLVDEVMWLSVFTHWRRALFS